MPRAVFKKVLAEPELLKKRLRLLTLYDAIVAPKFRSFEFHPKWGPGAAQMGAFKNGSGDFFFAWFSPQGTVIRGFDHESSMTPFRKEPPEIWAGLFDGLPDPLGYALAESAFGAECVTFAIWHVGQGWRSGAVKLAAGKDPDGAEQLLACFADDIEGFCEKYYGCVGSTVLRALGGDGALTTALVFELNPDADLEVVREEAALVGWATDALVDPRKGARAKSKSKAQAKPAVPRAASGPAAQQSFGAAEFVVRCEPTRVRMLIGATVVAEAKVDIYGELFDLVKGRLVAAKRKGA